MGARLFVAVVAAASSPAHAVLPTVPSHSVAEAAPAVGAGGLLQAGFGMVVVLGLIFLCAWLARRFGLQRFNGGNVVKVVSSSNVGQRERVVVVEVSGTWLVLGVTSSQINTLHTLPAQPMPQAPSVASHAALKPIDLFAQKLRESITGKTRPAP
ncbi:flagellar biosynthetic protein FliO [Variovorax sp. Sphag1AA]|uniref:flagellar biosynthetic protein FliO n=1 Tax=Variovorax sp. Sphag1AA TaxID=2587027 RepID=UPI0017CC747C|nr:flagellar biosynthetic protein FliO [Variovorax sp. Sphag1AA]MBB3179132.1 flagellar protein FliO/FliZ [Variovorax sp. Sphag1AA]